MFPAGNIKELHHNAHTCGELRIVLQCNKMLLYQTSKIQNFHFFFFLKEIINKVTWKMSFTGTWNLEIDEEYPKEKN